MMRNLSTELKVGLLILVGVGVIVYSSVLVTGWKPGQGDTYTLYATFDNVAGLLPNSPVQVAGIKVGEVDRIELHEGQPRVAMQMLPRYRVHADARATIESLGILGDKYIELTLGSPSQPTLTDGDSILIVTTGRDLDSLVEGLADVLDDVKQVTASLRQTLGEPEDTERLNRILDNVLTATDDVARITRATNERIDKVLENLDGFTASLKRITTENEQQLGDTVDNLSRFTASLERLMRRNEEKLDRTIDSVATFSKSLERMTTENEEGLRDTIDNLSAFSKDLRGIMADNRETLNETLTNLDRFSQSLADDGPEITRNLRGMLEDNRDSLDNAISSLEGSLAKLDKTMDSVESVSKKIDEGEGTVGRLVNDETTVEELNSALVGVNRYLTDLDRIKLDIGVRTERLVDQGEYKSYLSIYLQPLKDRYYLLELVDNPRGSVDTKTITRTTNGVTTTTEEVVTTDELQLSLLVAQRYFDTVLKGGLMENEFGVGIEQYFGSADQYRIGLDVWDFGNTYGPHAKATALWRFYSNAFMVAGYDDFLSEQEAVRDAFFGIGIRFNEDNLKPLVSSLPISAPGQ